MVLRKQIETEEAERLNDSDTEASFPPPVPGGKWKRERHRKTIIWREAANEEKRGGGGGGFAPNQDGEQPKPAS